MVPWVSHPILVWFLIGLHELLHGMILLGFFHYLLSSLFGRKVMAGFCGHRLAVLSTDCGVVKRGICIDLMHMCGCVCVPILSAYI